MDSEEDNVSTSNEASGDDDMFGMELLSISARKAQDEREDYPFEVLSAENIMKHMTDYTREVNSVVEIPETTIRILLSHFKWDKEKLLDKLYDGDQNQLFKDAHIINPYRSRPTIFKNPSKTLDNIIEECNICFGVFPSSVMTGLECDHRFCTQCWDNYLTTKIMEEGLCQTIACAAHACDILVDDVTVMKLVQKSEVRAKYQHLITKSFVECNRLLRWCPKPDCSNAIKVKHVEARPVTCSCGYMFCFACAENWHDPIKCHQFRKWIKKCEEDSATANWFAANTKACPKCGATIQKNGGCNHMTCKSENCKNEFCWVCLDPWKVHGKSWYRCNRYSNEEARAARNVQKISRLSIKRYLHYYERYTNHKQSIKLDRELYSSVKVKMEDRQYDASFNEMQFLQKAVDILCQCRQTLMYTYVFAYYVIKSNQLLIFEENQSDLEISTETLSEYLQYDITSDNLACIKQKVQDQSKYCEHRRKVLLGHVHEGYDQHWWKCLKN